jgi:cytochrome b561
METGHVHDGVNKYPMAMRVVHWVRAIVILGVISAGLWLVSLDDSVPAKYGFFLPYHKSFGVLALLLGLTQLFLRTRLAVPAPSTSITPLEARMADFAHKLLYVLMIAVPLIGYARSSTFPESDGVFFLGMRIPELLPKDAHLSDILSIVHRYLAYTLLGVILLHAAGAIKHRFFDKNVSDDPLSRML